MDIANLPPTPANATPAPAPAEPGESTAAITSDFETFLVMLTAQIQNQDPLNPMDNSEYAVQLATFSSVEQQVLTNELLEDMRDHSAATQSLLDLAAWVGLEARIEGAAQFAGDPLTVDVSVPADASWAKAVIVDDLGREVQRMDVTSDATSVTWDGRRADGTQALPGAYTVELHSHAGGEGPPDVTVLPSYQRITEVRSGENGMEVVFASGDSRPVDAVTALRQPPAAGS